MNALVIADDDEVLDLLSLCEVDLLISLGDLSDATIIGVAEKINAKRIYAVKGNHDTGEAFSPPIVDLHRVVKISSGIAFGGFCGCWKYNPVGLHLFEQKDVSHLMSYMLGVDVFIAHNSPRGGQVWRCTRRPCGTLPTRSLHPTQACDYSRPFLLPRNSQGPRN
jgi:hypothetical protein